MPIQNIAIGGKKTVSVTSITLVNNTLKTQQVAVPTGHQWRLLSIKVRNPDDVDRVVTIARWREAAKTVEIAGLISGTVTAGAKVQWPNSDVDVTGFSPQWHLIIMTALEVIEVTWAAGGASAGGTDADGLVIEYMDRVIS
jgi:hypothetical protein